MAVRFLPYPPRERGTLTISTLALTRLLEHACHEAVGPLQESPGRPGRNDLPRPRAQMTRHRHRTDVRLRLALPYPCDLRAALTEVEAGIRARAQELAGLNLRTVRFDIVSFETATNVAPAIARDVAP